MSNAERAEYDRFRTGLRYRDVYRMLWSPSQDSRDWRYKRRGTVLGLWRQLKLEMWAELHRREDERERERERESSALPTGLELRLGGGHRRVSDEATGRGAGGARCGHHQ